MANNLTGDFDVIAQFAVPAVNRMLAAMHRTERFPHSIALRVDDTSPPGHGFPHPVVIGVVDVFGDPVSDHASIRNPRPVNLGDFAPGSPGRSVASVLDGVANIDLAGIQIEPIQPSNLKGKAHIQLFPPTIEILDASGTRLTVRIELIARYIPDPGTPPVAQFVRGYLQITASLNQVSSQVGNVISVDVKSSTATINFTPTWSSAPIGAADLAGITQLIRNAIKTSFLPSNATLPPGIGHIQFKTTTGQHASVSVLLDMDGPPGNPQSANQSLVGGADGFAFGIGADYIRASFQPTLDKILEQQVDPVHFNINSLVHTWHITYTITLNSATLELETGKMVLVIKGHAHTGTSWLPDFNFTVKQDMTIAVSGPSASLAFGNVSLDTSSTIVDLFKQGAISNIERIRNRAIAQSNAQGTVSKMLSAEENLGKFLRTLLTPAHPTGPVQTLTFSLAYSSAEIRATGIIMHGSVGVPFWPPPRVEYEPISRAPSSGGFGHPLPDDMVSSGPDYSAFKTWIPGGTIDRYQWHKQGQAGYSDEHRFVLLDQGPVATAEMGGGIAAVAGYSPLCLTVYGTRLTQDGPVTNQQVTGAICGYRSFPVNDFAISADSIGAMIALARRSPAGHVEIVGHASPMADNTGNAPNLIVHFTGERSDHDLDRLTRALSESGRKDAPTAILVAAKASALEKLSFSETFTYVEDSPAWRRRYGVKDSSEATVIVNPRGEVVWRTEKPLNSDELATALSKLLVKAPSAKATMLTANARVGHLAPNFMFEHAPGQPLTLRKASGRKVELVFFNAVSRPSIDAVHDATAHARDAIVIAVSEGEAKEKESFTPAIVVFDHDRRIASAYGVTMWPTIVSIDEGGIVRSIAYGRQTTGEKTGA